MAGFETLISLSSFIWNLLYNEFLTKNYCLVLFTQSRAVLLKYRVAPYFAVSQGFLWRRVGGFKSISRNIPDSLPVLDSPVSAVSVEIPTDLHASKAKLAVTVLDNIILKFAFLSVIK